MKRRTLRGAVLPPDEDAVPPMFGGAVSLMGEGGSSPIDQGTEVDFIYIF